MFKVQCGLTPEAQESLKQFKGFKKLLQAAATEVVHEAAEDYKKEVVDMIENQTGAWAPLSPVWTAKKKVFNFDPRILIATRAYVDSFATDLGPLRGSVLGMWVLGRWIEYGTDGIPNFAAPAEKGAGRMPPRPHLIPALDRVKMRLPKKAQARIRDAFSRR